MGLVLLSAFAVGPTMAQDSTQDESVADSASAAEEESAPLVAEADRLRGEIAGLVERHQEIDEEQQNAEGDEARAELREMASIRLEHLDRLHALVDNLLAQEERGLDSAAALRAELEPAMRQMVPRLAELIDQSESALESLRASIDGAPPAERQELRDLAVLQLSSSDALYQGFEAHLREMERLGLDAGDARTALRERLKQRADMLAGWVRDVKARIEELRTGLEASSDDAESKSAIAFAEKRLAAVTSSLSSTLRVMSRLDLPTAEYQQLLIETTGEITGDVLDREVAFSLLRSWSLRALDWLSETGPTLLFKTLLFLVIMTITYGAARLTRRLVERAVTNSKLNFSKLLQDTMVGWASRAVIFLGLLIALSQLGIELGPLLAGLGVAGFIVGFALQDTLGNFASGAMILVYRPYDVGDMIDVAGVFGKVSKMSLVATTILTIDNQTMVVPNSKIWGDVIKNVTDQKIRRVDMKFGIAYGDDIERAEQVFLSILEGDDRVLADPPPMVRLHELGDSSVNFVVRPWVATADYWNVYWDTTRAVKLRLEAEGLHIPFPQRDVHLATGAGPSNGDEGEGRDDA